MYPVLPHKTKEEKLFSDHAIAHPNFCFELNQSAGGTV